MREGDRMRKWRDYGSHFADEETKACDGWLKYRNSSLKPELWDYKAQALSTLSLRPVNWHIQDMKPSLSVSNSSPTTIPHDLLERLIALNTHMGNSLANVQLEAKSQLPGEQKGPLTLSVSKVPTLTSLTWKWYLTSWNQKNKNSLILGD